MVAPVLYSYRRCPYAMRARMALHYAGILVEVREISLRQKPASLLQASPKGSVPVLVLQNGSVLEQSLDIMCWALSQRDIDGWLLTNHAEMQSLIDENDGAFKRALDRYKYPERFPDAVLEDHRAQCEVFLNKLETLLKAHLYLVSDVISLADIAIFPFIRQFAAVDSVWFSQSPYPKLQQWLSELVNTALFNSIMQKQPTFVDCF